MGPKNYSSNPSLGYSNRTFSTADRDAKSYVWAGRIAYVDPETMVCTVHMDTGTDRFVDVPISAPGGAGPRAFAGVIPEAGTKVLIGWRSFGSRGFQPVILDYVTAGIYAGRDFEKSSTVPTDIAESILNDDPELEDDEEFFFTPKRLRFRKAYSGEYLASSSQGADILLDSDVLLTDRSGQEIKLRESDQTVVLNAGNEYASNFAGTYSRGLIKRSSFSFVPDVYKEALQEYFKESSYDVGIPGDKEFALKVPKSSPSYLPLLNAGLIDSDGNKTFSEEQARTYWPYVVTSSGQHINYINSDDPTIDFANDMVSYVEDRKTLWHVSDGVLSLTEETDGFNQEYAKQTYIEEVNGTVVGNDPGSDTGRSLYKRILRLEVLDRSAFIAGSNQDVIVKGINPISNRPAPQFIPIDELNEKPLFNTTALAHLFRVIAPDPKNTGKQYIFAVSKEGKVFLNIPASSAPIPEYKDMANQSVDFNADGLVRMVIGKDPITGLSMDTHLQGGLRLNLGPGPKDKSLLINSQGGFDINLGLGGSGNGLQKINVKGSIDSHVTGNKTDRIDKGYVLDTKGYSVRSEGLNFNVGTGGITMTTLGEFNVRAQKYDFTYVTRSSTTYAVGNTTTTAVGIDSQMALSGGLKREVVAGSGISDTVGTGNHTTSVATGNIGHTVATGNYAATVGSGNLSLSASAGVLALAGSASTTISSASSVSISAPATKIGTVTVGGAVAGVPGPGGPHIDFITGQPIFGIPTIGIG